MARSTQMAIRKGIRPAYERGMSAAEIREARSIATQRAPKQMPIAQQPGMVAGFIMRIPFIGRLFGWIYAVYERLGLARTVARRQRLLGYEKAGLPGRKPFFSRRARQPSRISRNAMRRKTVPKPGFFGLRRRPVLARRPRI